MSSRPVAAVLAAVLARALACAGPAAVAERPSPSAADGDAGRSRRPRRASPATDRPRPRRRAAWWRDRVFYEVFVRSFADSDGDGIGDLRGLTAHLDYLNDGDPATTDDLGVTGLWLMPIAESPSYHGYDVVDYRTVEPDYGTADDLEALVDGGPRARHRGDRRPRHQPHARASTRGSRTRGRAARATTTGTSGRTSTPASRGPTAPASGTRTATASTTATSGRACRTSTSRTRPSPRSSIRSPTSGSTDVGVDGFRLDAARHLIEDGRTLENVDATFDWLRGLPRAHQDPPPGRARPRRGLGRVVDVVALRPRRRARPDVRLRPGERDDHVAALGRARLAARGAGRRSTELYPAGGLATFLTNHDQDRIMTELGGDRGRSRPGRRAAADRGRHAVHVLRRGDRPDRPEAGRAHPHPDALGRRRARAPGSRPGRRGSRSATTRRAPTSRASATDPDSLLARYRDLVAPARGPPGAVARRPDGRRCRRAGRSSPTCGTIRGRPRRRWSWRTCPTEPVTSLDARPRRGAAVSASPASRSCTGSRRRRRHRSITAAGGFEAYVPVERLAPRELVVLGLAG